MNTHEPPRQGLVLEGAGCRNAFQAGVLHELHLAGVRFDYVAGVSAGALNGSAVVLGRTHELAQMWDEVIGSRVVSLRNARWNRGLFNLSKITADLLERYTTQEELRAAATELAVVTTRLPSMRTCVYTNRQEVDLFRAIRASSFVPPFHSRPVYFDGAFHLDGGVTNNVPVQLAVEAGCQRIVVILHNPDGIIRPRPLLPMLVAPNYPDRKIIVIHPDAPIPLRAFDFRADRLKQALSMGRRAGQRALDSGAFDD